MKIDVFTLVFVVFALGICATLMGANTAFSDTDEAPSDSGSNISLNAELGNQP